MFLMKKLRNRANWVFGHKLSILFVKRFSDHKQSLTARSQNCKLTPIATDEIELVKVAKMLKVVKMAYIVRVWLETPFPFSSDLKNNDNRNRCRIRVKCYAWREQEWRRPVLLFMFMSAKLQTPNSELHTAYSII